MSQLPENRPRVSVIVLNWNGLADTLACLQSLEDSDYPNWDAVVVDNGSAGDDAHAVCARFPRATVLETGENLGYAGGNNVGLEHAARSGADYLFVLNNDTEVSPGCLSALVEAGEAHPEAAAIGCFVYAHEPPRPFLYAGLHAFAEPRAAVMGECYGPEALGASSLIPVDSAHGCGFALRRSAYEALGGFDARFFAMHEEVDWCMRARAAGHEILAAPQAVIRHKVGASFEAAAGERSPSRAYYDLRNRALYYGNRVGGRRLPLRWWWSLLGRARREFRHEWRAGRAPQAQAVLEGLWDAARGRTGRRRPAPPRPLLLAAVALADRLLPYEVAALPGRVRRRRVAGRRSAC